MTIFLRFLIALAVTFNFFAGEVFAKKSKPQDSEIPFIYSKTVIKYKDKKGNWVVREKEEKTGEKKPTGLSKRKAEKALKAEAKKKRAFIKEQAKKKQTLAKKKKKKQKTKRNNSVIKKKKKAKGRKARIHSKKKKKVKAKKIRKPHTKKKKARTPRKKSPVIKQRGGTRKQRRKTRKLIESFLPKLKKSPVSKRDSEMDKKIYQVKGNNWRGNYTLAQGHRITRSPKAVQFNSANGLAWKGRALKVSKGTYINHWPLKEDLILSTTLTPQEFREALLKVFEIQSSKVY